MNILISSIVIILWLIFWSFGSVIFFRLGDFPTRKTLKGFLIGRSKCSHCKHPLQTKDLIPLLSFSLQKGKCCYCHKKLSWRYPILEGATALIFLVSYLVLGLSSPLLTIVVAIGAWLLLIIFLYDIQKYELHITATLLLLILSFLGQGLLGYDLWSSLKYGAVFFIIFLIIYGVAKCYASRKYKQNTEGFGFWDVILAGVLWTMMSVVMPSTLREQMNMICIYLVLSCLLWIIYYAITFFISTRKKTAELTENWWKIIPFLPAMIIAFVIIMIWGDTILHCIMNGMDNLTLLFYS